MEITYIAHSCFKIKGQDLTIVIDPYDASIGYKVPKMSADVVLLSHDHFDHSNKDAVSGYRLLINTPGEYDVAGTSIVGYPTFHDDTLGVDRGKNTIFYINIDGFSILHLGDLGHELSKDTIERLPDIDILIIPVGGVYTINAETATKVISSIEPGLVIPMHYQTKDLKLGEKLETLDKFLNVMGIDNPKAVSSLKLGKRTDIPEDSEVIVLEYTA